MTLSDGVLYGEETVFHGYVYKVDVKDKTYLVEDVLFMDGEDGFERFVGYFSRKLGSKHITFTKGAMYCLLLENRCWYDEDMMDDMLEQINGDQN